MSASSVIRLLAVFSLLSFLPPRASSQSPDTVLLGDLDLSGVRQGWGKARKDRSLDNHPLTIAGTVYAHGIGSHSAGVFRIALDKGSRRLIGLAGIDDEAKDKKGGTSDFSILGNGSMLWKSDVRRAGQEAVAFDLDVSGVDTLELRIGNGGDNIDWDHADWVDARFIVTGKKPQSVVRPKVLPYVLTPLPAATPRLTGPKIFGARVGNPFLFTLTATGEKPIRFSVDKLPEGLVLDPATGRITGRLNTTGTTVVKVTAVNARGSAARKLTVVIGTDIALTPPLGWNSWNCFAEAVDAEKVKSAADALVKSGLADHGWSYINIDDCWMIKPGVADSMIGGPIRNADGSIRSNKKFPDMKGLADYIHRLGLKAGLYSSPGDLTCAGYAACYGHEEQDAQTYAAWEFDYLKYDWCSYEKYAKDNSLGELQKPYAAMRGALNKVRRDIVYSLCQYGMGDVWKWGAAVGGNCWRTTGDINDSWESVESIGFSQAGHEEFAGPHHWNDPDMLVVGKVGWGPDLHPTSLSPDEQYTHISLWSLLASPLLIGCDLTQLDPFTLNLLTNDEVLEVNQDPLGKQARRVTQTGSNEVWAKEMEDGSLAVGLFNRGETKSAVTADWIALGLTGRRAARDLWRQKNLGTCEKSFSTEVPSHGVVLVKLSVP